MLAKSATLKRVLEVSKFFLICFYVFNNYKVKAISNLTAKDNLGKTL